MSLVVDSYRFAAAGAFNPETDITWHSLFWAEGTDFLALGIADAGNVTSWPNETGETSAAQSGAGTPVLDTSYVGLNNQPAVIFGTVGNVETANFATKPVGSYSIVAVAKRDTTNTFNILCDGNNNTNRCQIYRANATGNWYVYAGVDVNTGDAWGTDAFLVVAYVDSASTADSLIVNGTTINAATQGNQIIDGIAIGANRNATESFNGGVALVGVFEGDVTADASWADFESWVTDHYGITIA